MGHETGRIMAGANARRAGVLGSPGSARLGETMVLFDWDGAVVVDADRSRTALNIVLGRRGLVTLGETEFAQRFRLPLSELLPRLGVPSEECAAAQEEWTMELAETRAHLRDGATECLSSLSRSGAWLGVMSGASPAAVRFDQRALGVPAVWNSVDASVGDKLELLLRHRPTRPQAFYVGQSPDDLRCASVAGYVAVGVSGAGCRDEVLRSAGAVRVIGALDELLAIVA